MTAQSSHFQRGNSAFRARPRYVTFQARTNQPTQGNYGLLRRTPAAYPAATAAAPAAATAAVAAPPAAAAAVVTAVAPIAAMEEAEAPIQEPMGAEGQTYAVGPYPDYVAYEQQNGYEVQEQDQVGMVEQWNFA